MYSTEKTTVVVDICVSVTLENPPKSSRFHSPVPKRPANTTGRKEKGELKTTSLTNDQNVSQENHLNETSPVSLLTLYGLSPRQYMNTWIPDTKYWSVFDTFFILSSVFAFWSTGATFNFQLSTFKYWSVLDPFFIFSLVFPFWSIRATFMVQAVPCWSNNVKRLAQKGLDCQ